ncbi:hypothetical protein T08_6757, partial [Trichinella sp. T8]
LARPSLFGDGPVLAGNLSTPPTHVNNHYGTPPPIFMSYSSYGSFSFLRLHYLQEKSR